MAKVVKIDSNVTGLRYAEEQSLKVLPSVPVWNVLEPNSYAEFGGSVTTVARNPINDSRQRKKGVVTDLDASGGFDTDITQTNLQDLLQGFMFADVRAKPSALITGVAATPATFAINVLTLTGPAGNGETVTIGAVVYTLVTALSVGPTVPYEVLLGADEVETVANLVAAINGAAGEGALYSDGTLPHPLVTAAVTDPAEMTITAIAAGVAGNGIACSETLADGSWAQVETDGGADAFSEYLLDDTSDFEVGMLILGAGFNEALNNGLHRIVSIDTDAALVVEPALVTEALPPMDANVEVVGFQFDTSDLSVDVSGSLPRILSQSGDLRDFGLIPGEWVFVGGDAAATAFDEPENNGFKRVRSVDEQEIVIDKSSIAMVADVGLAKTIQIFFGRALKNEKGTLIKRRTYQLERTLGAPDDAQPTQVQAEYLVGAVPNELVFNVPTADKATASLSFVATDAEQRAASEGLKSGDRPVLRDADAFNTSSDVRRIKMSRVVPGDEAPEPLFAFVTDMTVTINNNVTPNKAVGVLGAFDATAGTFEISGSLTVYFSDVEAVRAVRENADITLDFAVTKANAGFVVDLPLVSLGDGRPNVEQDAAITLPLTLDAATAAKIDTELDHTLMIMFFNYLPNAAG